MCIQVGRAVEKKLNLDGRRRGRDGSAVLPTHFRLFCLDFFLSFILLDAYLAPKPSTDLKFAVALPKSPKSNLSRKGSATGSCKIKRIKKTPIKIQFTLLCK